MRVRARLRCERWGRTAHPPCQLAAARPSKRSAVLRRALMRYLYVVMSQLVRMAACASFHARPLR